MTTSHTERTHSSERPTASAKEPGQVRFIYSDRDDALLARKEDQTLRDSNATNALIDAPFLESVFFAYFNNDNHGVRGTVAV